MSVRRASSPPGMSDQGSLAGAGTGKPTANSTASSPLATWASLRHSRLSAYGLWPCPWPMLLSSLHIPAMQILLSLQLHQQVTHSTRYSRPSCTYPVPARGLCPAPTSSSASNRERQARSRSPRHPPALGKRHGWPHVGL